MREQVEVLEHHADALAHRAQQRGVAPLAQPRTQREPRHLDLAGVERRQVVEGAQEGGLAAARRADDRHHLPAPHRQVDAAQDLRRRAGCADPRALSTVVAHAGAGIRRRSRRRARRPSGQLSAR